jgi:hypothetical protein
VRKDRARFLDRGKRGQAEPRHLYFSPGRPLKRLDLEAARTLLSTRAATHAPLVFDPNHFPMPKTRYAIPEDEPA